MLDSSIMLLFLLLSVPLSFLVFYSRFFPVKVETMLILRPLVRGLLLGVFGLILKWLMVFRLDFHYSFLSIFYYTFIHHGGVSIFAALLLDLVIRTFQKTKSTTYRLREISLQMVSFFTVFGLFDVIYTGALTGILEPVILPVVRIALFFMLILGTERFARLHGPVRILSGLFLLFSILLSCLIEMLSYYQLPVLQSIAVLLFLFLSLYLLYSEWKGRLVYGVKV